MVVGKRQRRVIAFRGSIGSVGRPGVGLRRERIVFWDQIALGATTEDAAKAAGVSDPVGYRWFCHNGGVNPRYNTTVSRRYLCFAEREDIALLHVQGLGVREIARRLSRSPSTISRELRMGASTRDRNVRYKATTAQWHAERRAKRPKIPKLVNNPRLREYVKDRLSGKIVDATGKIIDGPTPPEWKGRNKPRRQDRRWATSWSPEQISRRLIEDFPEDKSMRISHEAIYQSLYIQGRGGLKRELVACLRTGRALRTPRARSQNTASGHVTDQVMISQRPAQVDDRAIPGHWEGDLIIGSNKSAIGTLVERSTRFTILLYLPRMEGYGTVPRVKNGPALAGMGAVAVKNAIEAKICHLPLHLRQTLTWDQGKELAQHAQLTIDTGIKVYFCDPHSPWQRGTNENTNGLLRQYFPKGTDLSRWNENEIDAIANTLNERPRKTLGWKTPKEAFNGLINSTQQTSVATTT